MLANVEVIREALRKFNRRAGMLEADPYGIGLTLSQCSALVDVGRFEVLRPNDLVQLLRLDKSSVSRMLGLLEEKGLIAVSDHPADGRSKQIKLTGNGIRVFRKINARSNEIVAEVFDQLDRQDQKLVTEAFKKMSLAVDQLNERNQGPQKHGEKGIHHGRD